LVTNVSAGGVLFGVASALSFGIGDFAGGLASRRASGLAVAAFAQLVGMLLVAAFVALVRPELPDAGSLAIGAAAGLSGAVGVAALYVAMASGAMGLVASVSGAGSVTVPLLVGALLLRQSVHPWQVLGVACAAAAVLAAGGASRGAASRRALWLALLAALGFGLWYALLDRAATASGPWALLTSRLSGASSLLLLAALRGGLVTLRAGWRLALLSGVADVGGNALYVGARALMALGLAAALSGIYPLFTVLLARVVLRERLPRLGLAGVALALVAIVLISAG
jgi:drug/metabolite transporter (DMT)-like permease